MPLDDGRQTPLQRAGVQRAVERDEALCAEGRLVLLLPPKLSLKRREPESFDHFVLHSNSVGVRKSVPN